MPGLINNTTSFNNTGDRVTQPNTKSSTGLAFAKRTVIYFSIGVCTLLAPITAIAVGFKTFYHNYKSNNKIALSTNLRKSLEATVFTLPLIGPFVFYLTDNTNHIPTITLPTDYNKCKIDRFDYIMLSIPFMSSFVMSCRLIDSI
ncbi:MAG: hypothetical protein KAG53_09010 [Endozoicomonadaceae bacterium]|nr:hypothetical protein [Endozoicomonadaceae bacterium]